MKKYFALAVLSAIFLSGCAQSVSYQPSTVNAHALTSSTQPVITTSNDVNPFLDQKIYVDPTSQAARVQEELYADGHEEEADALQAIVDHTGPEWVGEWNSINTVATDVAVTITDAQSKNQVPVFIVYAIPGRDCEGHSAGGLTADEYEPWIDALSQGLYNQKSVILLEPDSLGQLGECTDANERLNLLSYATQRLSGAGATVYLDGGNSSWVDADEMARRLNAAGVEHARGFFTNAANYNSDADEVAYGQKISALTNNKHYVIDTSRNGNPTTDDWCNAPNQRLGVFPGAVNNGTAQDANLWIKSPGQSDGECEGGPKAGAWYEQRAQELTEGLNYWK